LKHPTPLSRERAPLSRERALNIQHWHGGIDLPRRFW
jgi:hypothetical protein